MKRPKKLSKEKDFNSINSHGFVRVAVAIPNVAVANPELNAQYHLKALTKAWEQGVQYALCPELGLTAYSCGDLFKNDLLMERAENALEFLLEETADWDMLITVGMPILFNGARYNCAVTFHRGKIIAVVPKAYPPEGREFYELRHFAQASDARLNKIEILGQQVPFGTDVLIQSVAHNDFILHTEICEDIWVPISPSAHAALAGATVLANLSASNITVGKAEYREMLVVSASGKNQAVQMYSAAGFGESSTDLAWDGDGYIAERGALLIQSERFSMNGNLLIQDVDVSLMVKERADQSSWHQNAADNKREFRVVNVEGIFNDEYAEKRTKLLRHIEKHPFVPSDISVRDKRCREVFMIQATALAQRLLSLPENMRKVVLGISGGQDSTHALAVAAYAMDLLKLPRTNVIGVTMPGPGTNMDITYPKACRLIRAFGATFMEAPIGPVIAPVFDAIKYDYDRDPKVAFENVQAVTRFQMLLAIAWKYGGIVGGTGDLSEIGLGWCTMFGDHASHYNVNGGVPKTLISTMIKWTADTIFASDEEVRQVLYDILALPISPELTPVKEGVISQKTEELIGPYELHDFFLYYFVRFGFTPRKIAWLCQHAFGEKYTLFEIKRWLKIFNSRFLANQFKRSCAPDGPKVGLVTLSPRGDWRMPSDADNTIWMDDVEKIPAYMEKISA